MPYESTIVLSIPETGSYQDIKEHIASVTSMFGMEPDKWSIVVTSEENSSWAYVYYTHPSPAILDRINHAWTTRFSECSIERVHRISNPKFFEDLCNKTKSGLIGIGMVQHLMSLSERGVTTTGMIEWMNDVRRDSISILSDLQRIRESPYEPGKGSETYP